MCSNLYADYVIWDWSWWFSNTRQCYVNLKKLHRGYCQIQQQWDAKMEEGKEKLLEADKVAHFKTGEEHWNLHLPK